ncbi:type III intermediate filament [Trematomus bernacchii]|uniref:type III intermediate filament n=1 Tax=Trematomus bernacchii TaxID=40690 RepID=UPI00146B1977|nr:type III intermediate filament [Trematomus bernacchii]
MAMLRVSSYRKLFEDERWSRNGGSSAQCAGGYRASVRGASIDECDCDNLDFVAAKALNKEGLSRFVQDRNVIGALNDRLVRVIELAHCFEEENESLECQIVDLEEQLSRRQASSSSSSVVLPHFSLDAVVERLRRERDEILCDTEERQKELERLVTEYEKAAQQRNLLQQDRQDVAEDVDAVTAECLALREQVAIYEEQLANMEAQHKTAVESMLEPDEGTTGAMRAITFGVPDITAALDVKEYYCQLAESLQFECGAASSAVVPRGDGKQLQVGGATGSTVKDLSKMKDVSEVKKLIAELQKELAVLEKCNEELEDEVEMKKAAYMDEIAELEGTLDEMRQQEEDFQVQMKEQCEDYKELLSEKMARDMEITAYRSLLEEEECLCGQ